MKRILLLSCLLLAACGSRGNRDASGVLSGVSGALGRAFASTSDDPAGPSPAVPGGGLCGDPALVGTVIGRVSGNGACGIEEAVSLTQVGDILLSQPATVDCATARAFRVWTDAGAREVIGNRGGGIASFRVASHYACRTRNHQSGAKISEHGKGKAIDISAMVLRDGTEITVLDGWGSRRDGAALRKMWQTACGPFGTVLGPNSDRFHRDHFHFDTAGYRSGSYCR